MDSLEDAGQRNADLAEVTLKEILAGLAVALGARRGAALALDQQTGTARLVATYRFSSGDADASRSALSPVCWQRLRADGQPVFLASGAAAPAADAAFLFGGAPYFAVPIQGRAGQLRGCFALEMPEPGAEQRRLAAAVAGVAATAIENAETARRQAEAAARSEALLEIVREMNGKVPLPQLLDLICRKTVQAFGLRQATIFYHHPRARGYMPLADCGTPVSVYERFVHARYTPLTTPHAADIVDGRTVVISRSGPLSPEDRDLLDVTELHALALLPLRTNDRTRGTLTVGMATEQDFTPEQIRELEIMAHHAATAIYQARSLRASEKAALFRAAVSALAVELSAESSRARILHLLCARGRAMFGASAGALLLAGGSELMGVAADTDAETAAEAFSIALASSDHPAVRAFHTAEVILADDLSGAYDPPGAQGFRSLLAVPLVSSGGVGGVLLFGHTRNPRHFDPRMVNEALVLGALAATALRNLDLLAQLYAANAELRRVSTLKDQFLANVSHDLRTPLSVIVGYGELAREGTFGEPPRELDEILGRMMESARQELALISDLLDLSRMELNSLAVKPAVVPLAPLFAELEFTLASMVRNRPVRPVIPVVPLDTCVWADRDRLRQILVNLLGNAAKFTESGTIELWAEGADDRIRIAVRDTGPGIAPEDQARIFEPFRQVEGAHAKLGVGLGLAIAQRLSQLMKGTLTVNSALGAGSTFWVTLPTPSASPPRNDVQVFSATR
jgi:signal transduction histidine kinase